MRRCAPAVVCAALALPGWPAPAAGGDWPHLRGPHYDAVSDERGLADSWPAGGPPLLWSRELGQGYSGFVAAGSCAYTQFQSVTAGQCVVCLDADSGSIVWQQHVDAPWQPAGAYPGPYATPTWSDGRVYYASPHGTAGCLDAATGAPVWSVNVAHEYRARGTGFGYACSPLVADGKVVLTVGGPGASVVALHARDGSLAWKSGDDPASYCPPLPVTVAGRRQVVAYLQNAVVGVDLATGRPLWRQPLSSDYDEHSAWPLFAEPDLIISAPFRFGAQAFRLGPEGSAAPKWASRELSNDVASSVLTGGHVYGFDLTELQARVFRPSRGRFVCLDAETGKLRWSTDRTGHATALAADGKLYLLNDRGELLLVAASPEGYRELGRCQVLGSHCWTPPSLSRGRLYLRDAERAVCLYVGDPRTLPAGAGRPAPVRRTLRIDWSRLVGREPEYPNDAPTRADLRRWFRACVLGVFLPAAVLAAAAALLAGSARRRTVARAVFWSGAFVLGVVATPVLGPALGAFTCTWPASLYAALAVAVRAAGRAARRPDSARLRWQARGVLLLFAGVTLGYYALCKAVGLMTLWAFLAGFPVACPFAVPAARTRWAAAALVLDACGFAAYFWASGLGINWRAFLL